jgi:integrase
MLTRTSSVTQAAPPAQNSFGQQQLKLTKTAVGSLPFSAEHQTLYWDTELPGFGLRVCKNSKTFIAQGRLRGRTRRISIGSSKVYTPDTARLEARRILLDLLHGRDPVHARKARNHQITLDLAFTDYFENRSLKESTLDDYKCIRDKDFNDWLKLPLTEISRSMVEARHKRLGLKSHARANNAMRVLRAVLNYAMVEYEDENGNPVVTYNPTDRLSKKRQWFRIDRRRTVIRSHELGAWVKAAFSLDSESRSSIRTIRDYLLLLLFTGLRRTEAAMLQWKHIDFEAHTIALIDTKNGEDHVLPMTKFLEAMLKARLPNMPAALSEQYVFPGCAGSMYLVEPRKQMAHVTKATGIKFTLHDLRRTFITVAESLDIPAYALKRLLNHKMRQDVTAGYIIADPERLREPMERISTFILSKAGMSVEEAVLRLGRDHT